MLSPYFILQHKEKLIKGDNEIKLQTDIKKIDVVFDQNNNVNQRISDKSTIEENTISNNITSILLRVTVGAQKAYDENGFLINNDKTFETKITNLKPCNKEVYEKDKKDFDEEVKKSGFVNFSNVSTKENSPIVMQSSKTNSNNDEELHKQSIIKYLQEQYKYTGDDTINKFEGNSNEYCVTVSSKTNWRCSKVFGKDWKKIIEPLTNLYLKNNDKDDNGNEKDNVRQIVFRFELIKTETNTYNNIVTYELKPKSIQFFWSEDAKRPYWLSTSSEDSIKVDISREYKVNNSNHIDSNRILLMVQTKN